MKPSLSNWFFSWNKISVEMVHCLIWIKNWWKWKSIVWFYSLNIMEKFSSIVEENLSFINWLKEQSERRNWKKENVHSVTVFNSTNNSSVQHFAFRLMSCFNSFIKSCPIWLWERSSVLSVCVRKSICVLKKRKFDSLCSLVTHQRGILLLHLRFDSKRDRVCWVSVFESRSVCWRRENSTHCVHS